MAAFRAAKAALREYGRVALGLYVVLWGVPFGLSAAVFAAADNLGQDPGAWIEWGVGVDARVKLWGFVGLAPDAPLPPAAVTGVLAYLVAEAVEYPRLAAVLMIAPRVKRALVARAAAKAARRA